MTNRCLIIPVFILICLFFKGYYWEYGSRSRLSDDLLSCDFVIDFTAGDSFTDLYGRERFFQRTRLKEMVEESGIPLILGSQTIGPFKDEDVREMAIRVLEKSKCVYVRDKESMQYVEQISSVKPILTTDIAFFLPYERRPKQPNVKKIGFNPSGLLWWGGYTKDNQFELKVDYQMYCRVILEYLLNSGYEVHLIMHAYFLQGQKSNSYPDNDRLAVESLYKDFPTTIIAPSFQTPMEAKSYISGMDLFIGARMHATIAALSASIPVIPFSYSRKFEGLFSSLEYPYVVEGTKWETKKAIDMTKNWVLDSAEMKNCISKCEKTIEDKNNFLLSEFNHTIENFSH